jgi:hypothetical protein
MLMSDFTAIAADRYVTAGDIGTARDQAIEQMKHVWGVTSIYGNTRGRLMAYPPETSYPSVAGSQAYLSEQLADLARERGVSVDNLSLVSDAKTKTAVDHHVMPGYLVSTVDPATGLDALATDDKGRLLRFFFDPHAAQEKAAAAASDERKRQNDPWVIINRDTFVGPFYPPWRPQTAEDKKMQRERVDEIMREREAARKAPSRASPSTPAARDPSAFFDAWGKF